MDEKVIITINTCQTDAKGEKDSIELITEGKIYKKNEAIYIVYEESEISGMEGTTTTLKIEGEVVTLKRFGNNHSQLVFEKGRRFKTQYKTPQGNLSIEILTKSINIDIKEDWRKACIQINYDINMGSLVDAKNSLHIKTN